MIKEWNRQTKKDFAITLSVSFFAFCGIGFLFLMPKYIKHIGGHEGHMGILFGLSLIPSILVAPWYDTIFKRISRKTAIISGIIILSTAIVLNVFIKRVGLFLYTLRIVGSIGGVIVMISCFSILSDIVPQKDKAKGFALFAASIQLAYSSGNFLSSKILEAFSFYHLFIVAGSIPLTAAFWVLFLSSDRQKTELKNSPNNEEISFLRLLTHKNYFSAFLLILVLGGVFGTILQYAASYLDFLHDNLISSEKITTPYFISCGLLTVVLSRVFFTGIIEKYNKKILILFFFTALSLCVILITLIKTRFSSILISIVFGLSYGFLYPLINASAINRVKEINRAKASAALVMFFDIGYFGIALIMGQIIHMTTYFTMFYVLFTISLIAALQFFIFEFKVFKKKALG